MIARILETARHPLGRRLTGYGASSLVAAATSELAFLVVYGWLGGGPTWATAAGFVGGAVPNYFLNRRWAWRGWTGRDRRAEVGLYALVAASSFAAAAFATRFVAAGVRLLTPERGWGVLATAAAYLGVSGVFFLVKFVLYDKVVFVRSEPRAEAVAARW